jgi:anti-sigma factor (TIGR02949 family)
MINCAGGATTQLLLDRELVGEELYQARAHLKACSKCMQLFENEERLSQLIRQAHDPQKAPSSLRNRIVQMAAETSPIKQGNETPRSIPILLPDVQRTSHGLVRNRFVLMAAILLVTVSAILFPYLKSRSHANSFIDAAIRADHGLSGHVMPLDVQSNSPKVVAAWFSGKVPFQFRLPNSGIAAEDTAKYTLLGGRLVDFRGEHAALIAFQMSGENISLLIASDRQAKAIGGRLSESGGLIFHTRQMENHRVVTWDNQGLTYALIFSASTSARAACTSCHADTAVHQINRTYLSNPF